MRPGLLMIPALALGVALADGLAGQANAPVPVRDAFVDRNGDRIPDRLGDTASVHGVVTSTPLVLSPEASLVNIQGATGGIVLFTPDPTLIGGLARGDSVRARGQIDQYRGTEQLLVTEVERLGRTEVPSPKDVLVTDLQGEDYSGQLVRVAGMLTARETESGRVDVELEDRTGSIPVYISARWFTHPDFAERLHRGGEIQLVGIASQQTAAEPPVDGYRIVPRDPEDFSFPTPPPYGIILLVALGAVGLGLVWWYGREHRRARELERLATDLKASQEELQAREQRFRSLVENAADTIAIIDPDAQLLYQSASVEQMLGWPPEELEDRNALELVHPDDRERVVAALAQVVEAPGETRKEELRLRTRTGSWRQVEVRATNRLHDPAVRGIVCNTRDITEQKALEQRLRDADRIEAIGRLAGGIAHDFNNVLTALRGHAELALEEARSDGDPASELDEIIRGADRATALTQQLLAFSRQRVMQPEVIAPAGVLEGMLPMLRRLIGEDIELAVEIDGDASRIRVDPVQLEQVVMNLAINARDAMPDGGCMTLELADDRIEKADAARYPYEVEPGAYVHLSVTDTGRGMDAKVLSRVFDPFFTTKGQGQGTGLGLATLFGIVKQSGGYVWADSQPGRGSRFDVYIPRVAEEAEGPRRTPTTDGAPVSGRGETILLVEDEDSVRELARKVLEKNEYRVLEAAGPEEALDLLREHAGSIDLLFTDVVMPGMSGGELAERIRASQPDLPTLFTSGYTEDEVVRRGVSAGEASFLEKPFTAKELLLQVRAALDHSSER